MIRLMLVRGGWIVALGGIGLWLVTAVALAQTPPPVVSPADISTPTPIPVALPTPTASPRLSGPQAASPISAARSIHDTPYSTLTGAVLTYTVQAGDTVLSVALEMGIDFDEVPCAVGPTFNPEQPLVIGDVLSAPPANMICHEVLPGETVASIAAAYFVDPAQIRLLPWNQLIGRGATEPAPHTHVRVPFLLPGALFPGAPPSAADGETDDDLDGSALSDSDFLALMLNLPVDTSPFVVFAQKGAARRPATSVVGPVPADWPYGSGDFAWPVYGWLSQSYRYDHRAIDVAAPQGSPVTAADRGVVLRAGWNNQGYGRFVIIDHKIDYITLYAHLDRVLVEEGEVVGKGQVIGTVGSTGNSTGPHLHFEIRDFGRLANPLELLAAP